jgi:hypothetical protein
MDTVSIITVILEGKLSGNDLQALAQRFNKVIHGEAVPMTLMECNNWQVTNIRSYICVGTSASADSVASE